MGSGLGTSRFRGAPLVELVVVVFILGVLAAVGIPKFLEQERRAVDVSMKFDLRAIAAQLETFYVQNNAYPTAREIRFVAPTLSLGAESVTLAPGNTPRIFLRGKDKLCLQVTNPDASTPTLGYVWRTDAGGLQPPGTTCAAYPRESR